MHAPMSRAQLARATQHDLSFNNALRNTRHHSYKMGRTLRDDAMLRLSKRYCRIILRQFKWASRMVIYLLSILNAAKNEETEGICFLKD